MVAESPKNPSLHLIGARWLVILLAVLIITPSLYAQNEDFDKYKIRIDGFWFYSSPTVTMTGEGHNGFVDFDRNFGFDTYSTFAGKIDWKFTRKNHFYVTGSPFSQSRQVVLSQTVNFRGQTFPAGLTTKGNLEATLIAPGYQYDVIRRKRGHLGLAVQVDLFNTKGTLSAATQVANGVLQPARSIQGSLLAPVPVAGPEFRLYLTNSPRLFVEGNVYGMYFFGYGNFISSAGDLGLSLSKHFSVNAGYQMGSRLDINNNASSRIGLSLTQKGPIVGAELSF
jgi:hypothetical protein